MSGKVLVSGGLVPVSWNADSGRSTSDVAQFPGWGSPALVRPPWLPRMLVERFVMRTRKSSRFALALLASVLAAALLSPRFAAPTELPPGKQAIFLARVIAYDAHLRDRAGAAVNIGVLARKGDKDSEKMADLLVKAWKPVETATLLGLPVRVTRLWFTGREALDRAVREGGIDTIYVCSGLDASLADVKAVTRARRVLTWPAKRATSSSACRSACSPSTGATPSSSTWRPIARRALRSARSCSAWPPSSAEQGRFTNRCSVACFTSAWPTGRHSPGGRSQGSSRSPNETRQRARTWLPSAAKMRRTSWYAPPAMVIAAKLVGAAGRSKPGWASPAARGVRSRMRG